MADFPDQLALVVELAFGADPDVDPDEWTFTDVSADLLAESVSPTRGTSDEGTEADASTFAFTLDNNSGDYTPGNALSPHYPNVKLNVPCRLSVVDLPVELGGPDPLVRGTGFVSEWLPEWPAGDLSDGEAGEGHAVIAVTVAGILRRLGQGEQALDSAIFRSVQRAANVVAYWPMEDGGDAESFAPGINGGVSPMSFDGDVDLAGQDPPDGSKLLPFFKPGSSFSGPIPMFILGTDGDGNSWRADWVYRQDESTSTFRTLLGFRMADAVNSFIRLRVSSTTFNVQILDDEGIAVVTDDEAVHPDFFGQWLHVSLIIQGSSEFTYQALVRDSTQVLHSVVGSTGSTPPRRPTSVGIGQMASTPESRRVGHVAISSDRLNASFQTTALDGYAGEPAATRFERLCEEEGLRCELIAPDPVPLNDNTGFEVDMSGWGVSFGTLTRSTAQAFEGVASGLLEPSGGNANVDAFIVSSSAMRVRPGGIYQWSVWVFSPDGWHDVRLYIQWRDVDLTGTGSVVSDAHVVPAGVWTQLTLTASPSSSDQSDTRFATPAVRIADTPTVTDVLHIDEAIFTVDDTSPMGPQRPDTLLTLLRECAMANGGIFGETLDGFGLLMRTRRDMYNQAPALVLDAGDGPGQITHPFTPTLDDQQARNDITVDRPEGSSARAVDEGDVSERGRYSESSTVNVATDGQLPNIAAWRLHLGTWPGMRYPQLSPALNQVPDLIPTWAALRLGDRVQVVNLPPQHPADAVDLLVQGYTETLTPTSWDATANMSPAGPWSDLAVFDASRFDTEHATLAAEFVAGTDTSMSVATAQGPLWTTDAGDLPLEIAASGVVLEVTAISGASSPQTFTVSAATVNGVQKTIPAGEQVHLHPRPRFAL